jgi:hypothetical protein
MEGTSRNDMSHELRKTAVRLWRYGRNTGILAHPPYDTKDDLGMLWDHSQLIPTVEKPYVYMLLPTGPRWLISLYAVHCTTMSIVSINLLFNGPRW